MKQTQFVGRTEELRKLRLLTTKSSASLVVLTGRRRIGKSRLIQEFGKKGKFYVFSGIPVTPHTTIHTEREEFARQLSLQFDFPLPRADDWNSLFHVLAKLTEKGKVIILLDEISWMGSKDPDFLGKLKNAWDLYFSRNPELILVLCGSVSSWIDKNILSSTGFLGRISLSLILKELPLYDCDKFWNIEGVSTSAYEKLKILAVTGGVPKYLEEIHPALSAEENIKLLCFDSSGLLFNEFNQIFSDLFSTRAKLYQKIIEALVSGVLEFNEICEKIGLAKSGLVSEYLDDLIKAGFISRDFTWHIKDNKESSLSHYRLSDNYLRFYLKYILSNKNRITAGLFQESSLSSLQGWSTVMGLQVENMIVNNKSKLFELLYINPEEVVCSNPFFQNATKTQSGCQIDYLIQTKFNTLYVCEVKYFKNGTKSDVIKQMKKKIENLKIPKYFTCRPVLIYANQLSVDVESANYFSNIINMESLLSE